MAAYTATFDPSDHSSTARRAIQFTGVVPGANSLTIDVTKWLGTGANDAVCLVNAVVMPSKSVGDMALDNITWDGASVTVNLTGGLVGVTYMVQISITALDGRTLLRQPEFRM